MKDLTTSPSLVRAPGREEGSTDGALELGRGRRRRRSVTPYLFLLVPVGLLLLFTYVPILNMLSYSFVKWNGLSADRKFVGLDNYVRVFTQPELFGVFFVSLYYFVGAFVQMAIALYLATMLSFRIRFKNLFKGLIFFPYLINGVAISFIFLYVLKPDGVLDSLLATVGINDPPLWTGDRSVVNVSLASVSIWRYLGLNFVLFLGAIQSIPSETMEAAEIDGASRWRTLPPHHRAGNSPGDRPELHPRHRRIARCVRDPVRDAGRGQWQRDVRDPDDPDGLHLQPGRPRVGHGRDPARPHPAGDVDPAPRRARRAGGADLMPRDNHLSDGSRPA